VPFSAGAPSACRGGPRFLSGRVTANTRLDQQLSHPLNCLVIFDVLRQSGISTCFATSCCASLAQGVSDVRVHAARLPYLRLILPPSGRPSLYLAASASAVNSFSIGRSRNSLSPPELRRWRGDAVSCVDEMAVSDAGLVGDQSEVPVSPPDDRADGLLAAEPSVLTRHGRRTLSGLT
jgi:hypothetical protein